VRCGDRETCAARVRGERAVSLLLLLCFLALLSGAEIANAYCKHSSPTQKSRVICDGMCFSLSSPAAAGLI
jgi:hypothetical protein